MKDLRVPHPFKRFTLLILILIALLPFQNCGGLHTLDPAVTTDQTGNTERGNDSASPLTPSLTQPPFFVASNSVDRSGFILPAAGQVVVPAFGKDEQGRTRGIFYSSDGQKVFAYDTSGKNIWTVSRKNLGVVPSLDWNKDGIADAFVSERIDTLTSVSCYDNNGDIATTTSAPYTWLHLLNGLDGSVLYSIGSPLPDFCWSSPSAGPTLLPQWTPVSSIASQKDGAFAVAPYYATQSWIFLRDSQGQVKAHSQTYPSTSAFAAYDQAQTVDPAGTVKHWTNAHAFNGLFSQGQFGYFTSGRYASFHLTEYSSSQLSFDVPFQPSGHTEGSGRNYGLVAKDPFSSRVSLISGCSVYSLYQDLLNGNISYDPYCGINRHFTMIDTSSGQLIGSRFYSYVHNGGTGASNYLGRVLYPSNPILKSASGPSHLIYNVYENGYWNMHISQPGVTEDLYLLKHYVVWDVIDIDGDGADEILFSPTKLPSQPDVPGYYFPQFTTYVGHFNQAKELVILKEYKDRLPLLVQSPKRDSVSSSENALMSAVRVLGKTKSFYMIDSSKKTLEQEYE
ncbi:hypothetical protein [Bdellovibrio sp. HCB-110]|uniref:hypothetical protein n=1 Tax=Bdellovibrio sp. HCB-110 TaxID=3391182 RepID=UPI0039B38EF1